MSNGQLRYGDRTAREVSARVGGNFASTTVLRGLGPKHRADGMIAVVDSQEWIFIAGDTGAASATCLVPTVDTTNSGRWRTSNAVIFGSGASGQTVATGITGIRCGTGLSTAIANGQLVIWVP